MSTFHSLLVWVHIVAGTIAIATFWVPTLSKKGGVLHKRVGNWYTLAMYTVAITATAAAAIRIFFPLSLIDATVPNTPEDIAQFVRRSQLMGVFLSVLALLVFANVRHGVLVLRTKAQREMLRSRTHLTLIIGLGVIGLIGLVIGVKSKLTLLLIFSPLAMLNSAGMLRYCMKAELKRSEWIIEHLGNLLGAGIATHTALLVLGAARWVNSLIPVSLSLLPWLAPSVIGVIAITLWTRHYRRRLGHIPTTTTTDAIAQVKA